jgi:hypothetical protein
MGDLVRAMCKGVAWSPPAVGRRDFEPITISVDDQRPGEGSNNSTGPPGRVLKS